MGDEDAGNADAVDRILQPVAQFLADLGVDGGKGLIQEQDLGIRCQSPGKGHALALTAGELVGITLFHARQADEVDHFQDPLPYLLFRPLLDFQAEGDVIENGHIAEQGVVLEDEADAPLGSGNVVDPAAVDEDVAAVGILQAGQHAQNRRLAAAAGTEEGDELALVDAKGNVARRVELGHDADAGHDEFELVGIFAHRIKRFVFPGDKDVALSVFDEGRRRTTGTGIHDRDVAIQVGHKGTGLDLISPEMVKAPTPGGQEVPAGTAATLRVRRNDADAGLCQIIPVAYPFRVPLADQEDDGRRVRRRIVGEIALPAFMDEAGFFDKRDIMSQGQGHNIGLAAFNDRTGLTARSTMGLDDADILSCRLPIVFLEQFIIFFI